MHFTTLKLKKKKDYIFLPSSSGWFKLGNELADDVFFDKKVFAKKFPRLWSPRVKLKWTSIYFTDSFFLPLCLPCSESSVFDRVRIEGKFEAKKELRRTGSQSYEKVRFRAVWLWEMTWVELVRGESVGVISRGDDECWTLALKMPEQEKY